MMKNRSFLIGSVVLFVCSSIKTDTCISHMTEELRTELEAIRFLEAERGEIFARLELAAGNNEEARMLIEYHRPLVVNTRLFFQYAIASGSDVLHSGVDQVPPGSVLIFPATHEMRRRAGSVSESNFRFDRGEGTPVIDVPLLERFTRLWFGVRTLHEFRHCYDALSGLEPDLPFDPGHVSRAFAEGEVRAHSLEQRLLDQASHGRFSRALSDLALRTEPPEGFPEVTRSLFPNAEVEFERLNEIFEEEVHPDELNTRWGSFNVAAFFALCDRLSSISDCHVRFVQAYFSGHPLR